MGFALSFILLTCFWGCSFIAIRESLISFSPFFAALIRIAIGGAVLGLYAYFKGIAFKDNGHTKLKLMGIGVVTLGFPWACLFWGEKTVDPAVASIINSTVPLFVALYSWFLLKTEIPNKKNIFAVLLGFGGIVLVLSPALGQASLQSPLAGLLAIVMMAVSYGLGTSLVRKMGQVVSAHWSMFYQAIGGVLFLTPVVWVMDGKHVIHHETFQMSSVWALIYLGLVSTALAWVIYYDLIHRFGAVLASAVTYTVPFVAIIIDVVFLNRLPKTIQLVGALIISVSLLLMRFKSFSFFQNGKTNKLAA